MGSFQFRSDPIPLARHRKLQNRTKPNQLGLACLLQPDLCLPSTGSLQIRGRLGLHSAGLLSVLSLTRQTFHCAEQRGCWEPRPASRGPGCPSATFPPPSPLSRLSPPPSLILSPVIFSQVYIRTFRPTASKAQERNSNEAIKRAVGGHFNT